MTTAVIVYLLKKKEKADAVDLCWEFPGRKRQVNDSAQQKESYKCSFQLQEHNCSEVYKVQVGRFLKDF